MFSHILVPTDLTQNSLRALEIAVEMASHEDVREITLLHVIETLESGEGEDFDDFYRRLEARARKAMKELAAGFKRGNVAIKEEIAYGNRVKEIVRYAHEKEIGLIILSSHRIEETDAYHGWATISYKVGILSHCPVMMVK